MDIGAKVAYKNLPGKCLGEMIDSRMLSVGTWLIKIKGDDKEVFEINSNLLCEYVEELVDDICSERYIKSKKMLDEAKRLSDVGTLLQRGKTTLSELESVCRQYGKELVIQFKNVGEKDDKELYTLLDIIEGRYKEIGGNIELLNESIDVLVENFRRQADLQERLVVLLEAFKK